WIVAYMGITMAGGCAALVNGFSTGEEMADAIRMVSCRLVLADRKRAERLEGTAHGATILPLGHDCNPADGLEAVWGDPAATPLPTLTPDDYATLLYTSGSTGRSKGAYSDHRGVVHGTMSYVMQSLMALTYMQGKGEAPSLQPTALVSVPLFHVTGEVPVFLQSFALGRKLVLMKKWDAGEALRLIEAEKVTYFTGVPLMSYEMATHPDREKYDTSTCTSFAAGGAPRPTDHVEKIHKAFPGGFPLLGYGLTETNAIGCGNFNENYLAKPTSTGKASRPLVDMAILDEAGNKLPDGEVGEICIRTVANFLGYWDNREATKEAFTDDMYFRTGDLGRLDEDGYLFIVDRKKDIIIRGGENIACLEVEGALHRHPDVAEAGVFPIPDERLGEIVGAGVQLKPGARVDEAGLQAFLADHLAAFKIPDRLWLRSDPLPRGGTDKTDRRALRAQCLAVDTEAGAPINEE
ncbi:MAG TPA: AMP-dependent synthetase, partial [Alcanivorax sp.]|nr:AMP-dependent synthetase [Alcanivorax sp.]